MMWSKIGSLYSTGLVDVCRACDIVRAGPWAPRVQGIPKSPHKIPIYTLYMGFYCRNINRRAHGCAILGFT